MSIIDKKHLNHYTLRDVVYDIENLTYRFKFTSAMIDPPLIVYVFMPSLKRPVVQPIAKVECMLSNYTVALGASIVIENETIALAEWLYDTIVGN